MKKGQVTIFIILGIVILAIAIVLIIFSGWFKTKPLEDATETTQRIESDLKPVVNYIESCIDTVTKEGIFLLGKQAGVIYKGSQGGRAYDYPASQEGKLFLFYPSKSTKVLYLINQPTSAGLLCAKDPPKYPVSFGPYPFDQKSDGTADLSSKIYKRSNCFGKGSYTSLPSMLEDLRLYLENNLESSCDMSSFTGFDIQTGKPKANITSTGQNTVVHLEYPVKIENKNTGSKVNLKDFTHTISFSFKEITDFVDSIIQEEIDDPTHNIKEQGSGYQKFEILVIPDVYDNDDLIKVRSDMIRVDGQKFEFIFARKNRNPVLEYLYNVSTQGFNPQVGDIIRWDDVFHQELEGVDPDEDSLNFTVLVGPGKVHEWKKSTDLTLVPADFDGSEVPLWIQTSDGELIDYEEKKLQ